MNLQEKIANALPDGFTLDFETNELTAVNCSEATEEQMQTVQTITLRNWGEREDAIYNIMAPVASPLPIESVFIKDYNLQVDAETLDESIIGHTATFGSIATTEHQSIIPILGKGVSVSTRTAQNFRQGIDGITRFVRNQFSSRLLLGSNIGATRNDKQTTVEGIVNHTGINIQTLDNFGGNATLLQRYNALNKIVDDIGRREYGTNVAMICSPDAYSKLIIASSDDNPRQLIQLVRESTAGTVTSIIRAQELTGNRIILLPLNPQVIEFRVAQAPITIPVVSPTDLFNNYWYHWTVAGLHIHRDSDSKSGIWQYNYNN